MGRAWGYLLFGCSSVFIFGTSCSDRPPQARFLSQPSPAHLPVSVDDRGCGFLGNSTIPLYETTFLGASAKSRGVHLRNGAVKVESGISGRGQSLEFGPDLLYSFSDSRFATVHTARILDSALNRFESYGLNLNQFELTVVSPSRMVNGDKLNAFYRSGVKEMHFDYLNPKDFNTVCGSVDDVLGGGLSSGLDGDTVAHELGHAVEDYLSVTSIATRFGSTSLWGSNDQYSSISEGLADIFSYLANGSVDLGRWFGVLREGRFESARPYRLDEPFKLGEKWWKNSHKDGVILAAVLYDLAQEIGEPQTFLLWVDLISRRQPRDTWMELAENLKSSVANRFPDKVKVLERIVTKRGFDFDRMKLGSILDLEFKARVFDQKDILDKVTQFALSNNVNLFLDSRRNDGDGSLEPGECAFVDLQVSNQGQQKIQGVELFLERVGSGLSSQWGNYRSTLGNFSEGESTERKNFDLNEMRENPWLVVCSDGSNRAAPILTIQVRSFSFEKAREINLQL